MTPDRRVEVCVGAVAVRYGRLLLVQRATDPGAGLWSLPGGRVEAGELMVMATVRELREETGLDGLCGGVVGWVERIDDDHHFVIVDFEVEILAGQEPRAGSDASAVEWVPLTDVLDRPLVDGLAEFLADHDIITTIV
ncbi:MAG: NUDIX domain-containing protein [Acidimicrobiales bacterium]|nr:NUDIX domain-containing protein [Acidimicrobiales bacterium]